MYFFLPSAQKLITTKIGLAVLAVPAVGSGKCGLGRGRRSAGRAVLYRGSLSDIAWMGVGSSGLCRAGAFGVRHCGCCWDGERPSGLARNLPGLGQSNWEARSGVIARGP